MPQTQTADGCQPETAEGIWAGFGENRPCHVCARLILPQEVQIKIAFGPLTPQKTFHRSCYEEWVAAGAFK